jgi:signal transduction histidine kinase/DNA-binding response OmpR family regulator
VKADLDNETFRVINADKAESFRRYNNFASDFLKDSKGYIWIYNVLAGGIKRLNPQKETVVLFNNPDDDVPEKDVLPFLHGLVEMDNGDIYTIGDYIYKLNEDSLRFERFKDEPIPNMVSIEESAQGQLVVATYGEGVFWINPKTKEIDRRISAEDGLANSSISDMRIDEQGRYWLLTSLGLSIYNPKQDVVTNYYENHGLPASESQINYKFFGNDSTYFPIWLSNKGLSAVHVNQMETNSYSPSPVFTNITADDESLLLSESNSITLSPDQREVTVAFSALQFDDPSKNQYRYSFEGADWSSWSRKRSVQLAGLAPGTYTLEVQSRNPDLIPSANVATLSLTVLPPWYQTAWAWTLLGVTILGALGWGARRYSDYRTEQEYLRLQAEQSERLQKIDQLKTNLLLNISHELRTPLTLILAPIDQLRRRMQTNEPELKRPLEIARRNGKRMQQLVEQVLDLARLEMDDVSFEVRPIEINKQLKRLVDFFESLAEFNEVELQLKPLPEEEMLWVDPDKFEKVIINLISNAIKFTESGGEVVVRMDKQDGQLHLQVQDSGKGIAPERLEQIFERFETSAVEDAQGAKGLGVGLSITKEYVELHHGRITVKSQPGEGTIFTITLPLGKDHIAEEYIATDQVVSASEEFIEVEGTAVEIKPRTSLLHGEKPLILVIEDNEDLRSFMVDILREDYRVETAWDGKEGVKRAQVLQPDLVITDIMMPEMDGFGVIEKLRSQHRFQRLPIVVLSARSEMADRLKGFEMGVNAYIGKPFNTDELLVRVRNMLELKEKRDEASADSTTSKEQLSEDEQTLKELIEYVNEHIQESTIKVETLAEVINVSRSSLYRLLKANTGFTPAEFVRELKLQKASELIEKNPKLPIAELADRVGYSNSTYFSRLYKERFGKRPK